VFTNVAVRAFTLVPIFGNIRSGYQTNTAISARPVCECAMLIVCLLTFMRVLTFFTKIVIITFTLIGAECIYALTFARAWLLLFTHFGTFVNVLRAINTTPTAFTFTFIELTITKITKLIDACSAV
jgi:hypothetical protein